MKWLIHALKTTIKLSKEMKMLDKEVRVWDVYMGLESTVKNLLTSLRAVNELQNSAVRERHWQQLMNTTGVWQRPVIIIWNFIRRPVLTTALFSIYCIFTKLQPCFNVSTIQLRCVEPNQPDQTFNPLNGWFVISQVRFIMGEGTTLGDLLELQLHRVEDEVKNIVDKAVKEMAIEKVSKWEYVILFRSI